MRTLISISLASYLTLPVNTPPDEINRLNECIQQRFLDRKAFGMQRVARSDYHDLRLFQPENATEQSLVDALERNGYQVALYLAGRSVNTTPAPWSELAAYRYGVQGPAYITRFSDPKEAPAPASLLEESPKALRAFESSDGYDIQKGDWSVALRPLRATGAACIQCHNAFGAHVKIGDPIGVVMYAYKR